MILKQPILGIVSTTLCIVISLTICAQFSPLTFNTWVSFLLISCVPPQVILALALGSEHPAALDRKHRIVKGAGLTFIMTAIGLVAAYATFYLINGSIVPPAPMAIMFAIFCVVISMWVVVVFQAWPTALFIKKPLLLGSILLLVTYVISYILFQLLFNFDFLTDAPFYNTSLDPQGICNAWDVLIFSVSTICIINSLIMLDFHPILKAIEKSEKLAKQPFFGIINGIVILVVAYTMFHVFINILKMDKIDYMVQVVVSFIFGQFIMQIMMQTSPFTNLKQPLKGVLLILSSLLVGLLLYIGYKRMAILLVEEMQQGAPTYELSLWLASSMLAVTFPLLIIVAEFFKFWPFKIDNDSKPS